MKILGISGSSRSAATSGTYKLVEKVLEATACDYELVSLKGKTISGCTGCLGCVEDNVCKVQDDMGPLREKMVEADAFVIGAPNFYGGMNAQSRAFLERLYQFRHRAGDTLWGKLAVAVGVGGLSGEACCDEIERMMAYRFVETVAKVSGQGAGPCYCCGYGETCQVGVVIAVHGPGVKITEDMIPDVAKQPEVMSAAENAGKLLAKRLNEGHDRQAVTQKMQQIMMEKFKEPD